MTERPSKTAPGSGIPGPQSAAASRGDSDRRRASHPLLGAFPLAVMALATFLVIFTVMMARLTAGVTDPALHSAGSSALVEPTSPGRPVTTRASGASAGASGAAAAMPVTSGEGAAQTAPAVLTRTSGGGGVGHDD